MRHAALDTVRLGSILPGYVVSVPPLEEMKDKRDGHLSPTHPEWPGIDFTL